MKSLRILFLCTGNSCRSQMAEGWARQLVKSLPDYISIDVASAGIEAHGLNPLAVIAMAGMDVDISSQQSKVLTEELMDWADILVSVCSHADNHCPALGPDKFKLHLPFDDPASASGNDSEVQAVFERVSLQIRDAVSELLDSLLLLRLDECKGNVFDQDDVEILSRQSSHHGFIPIQVLQLKHRLFKGGWSGEIRRELAIRKPAVGVLLYDTQSDEVVLIRQFRTGALYAYQSPWLLEVVAGLADAGEAPEDVVKREAKEEANCDVIKLIPICKYYNSPGWSDEKVCLFCGLVDAQNVEGVHGLDEEHEDILVVKMSADDAIDAVSTGEINNAMTIIAIQWLQLNRSLLAAQGGLPH